MFPFHLGFKYLFYCQSGSIQAVMSCSGYVYRYRSCAVQSRLNGENVRDLSVDVTTTVTTIATEKNRRKTMPVNIADQGSIGPLALLTVPDEFIIFYSSPVHSELWCPVDPSLRQ